MSVASTTSPTGAQSPVPKTHFSIRAELQRRLQGLNSSLSNENLLKALQKTHKPNDIVRFFLDYLGFNDSYSLPEPEIVKSMVERKTEILKTEKALLESSTALHVLVMATFQENSYSGLSQAKLLEMRQRQVGSLPMPCTFIRWLRLKGNYAIPDSLYAEWDQKEKRCKELLFAIVDNGRLQVADAEECALLEQFFRSKAAYYDAQGKPVFWPAVLEGYAQEKPDAREHLDRLLYSNCVLQPFILPPVSLPPKFPECASLSAYVVACTLEAISKKVPLPAEMQAAWQETLCPTKKKDQPVEIQPGDSKSEEDDTGLEDLKKMQKKNEDREQEKSQLEKLEEGRCDLTFFFAQKDFSTIDFPEDSKAFPMLDTLQCYIKFQSKLQGGTPPPENLLKWIFRAGHKDHRHKFNNYNGSPLQVITADQAFQTICREFNLTSYPEEKKLMTLLHLAGLKSLDNFIKFLHTVRKCEAFIIDQDFIFSFLSSGHNPLDFSSYMEMVEGIATILKNFNVKDDPQPGHFWVRLFKNKNFDPDRIAEFQKEFNFLKGEEALQKQAFCLAILKFFEGKITMHHVRCLEGLRVPKTVMLDILTTQHVELKEAPPKEVFTQKEEKLKAVQERWNLTPQMVGVLLFEFLNLEIEKIDQQLRFLEFIETYTSTKLRPQQVFGWLRYFPDPVSVQNLLLNFAKVRQTLIAGHLNDFVIPKDLYHLMAETISSLVSVSSSKKEDGSEYLQSIAEIATQMQWGTITTSPQPWADFIDFAAAQDLAFKHGEDSRVTAHIGSVSPFFSHQPAGPAILRRWNIPQNPSEFPTYVVDLIRVATGQTYRISATLNISWTVIKEDLSARNTLTLLQKMASKMGEETSYFPDDFLDVDSEFELALAAYPAFKTIWDSSEAPKLLAKADVEEAGFAFVKKLKLGYRKGFLSLYTTVPPDDPFDSKPTGHIYPLPSGRLSLFPSNRTLSAQERKMCTIHDECNTIIEGVAKLCSEAEVRKEEFSFDKFISDGKLMVEFDPRKVDEDEHPVFLNQITLTYGKYKSTIRYKELLKNQDLFPLLLKRQLMEILACQFQ
jgi:hypothetical protein